MSTDKNKSNSPFDYIKSISNTKKNIYNDGEYNSFIVNRGLSFYADTILYANEMNKLHELDDDMKYDYLFHGIKKRNRYTEWISKANNKKEIEMVMKYYNCNYDVAKGYYESMSVEDFEMINNIMSVYFEKK